MLRLLVRKILRPWLVISREGGLRALRSLRAAQATIVGRRRRIGALAVLIAAFPFVLVVAMALVTPLPAELREGPSPSLRVLSKNGHLLREVRTDDGARARPLPLRSFPSHVLQAVLAAEDRDFYAHGGVDVSAAFRAAFTNVTHARAVSGASTLTMQLARTLRPHRRNLWGKLKEAALALRIETSLSKDRIFEEYLNRVTFGPNLRGYASASQAYLGALPESLSLAEAALIAGLPRGPSLYAVTKHPALAKRRRDRVLARMARATMIDEGARDRAIAEPVAVHITAPSFGAPHLVQGLVAGALGASQPGLAEALRDQAGISEVQTTIDPELQRAAEGALTTTLSTLIDKHVTAAAVVVLDNATGDVLTYIGSPDFFDAGALGQNDGVRALRQPGSALKPFLYAEAMSHLGYTGATLLPDVEIHIPLPGGGDYVPHDYDARQRGPTRLREALGNSLNVPAVYTLHRLGTARFLDRLHALGFASLTEDAEHYGPALALGDGEVTLLELANAYATLARGGLARPVRLVTHLVREATAQTFEPAVATRVIDERVARMVTDILSDKGARVASFGDQNVLEFEVDVAAKTGTSKAYRDNVAVGYTREVTVAAWAGNFDGSPMLEVSGVAGAGPIFHAVMEAALAARSPTLRRHSLSLAEDASRLGLSRTAVCALSGEVPTAACPHRVYEWLPEGDANHAPSCRTHTRVRIDTRNGLRAGADCPSAVTQEHVFEHWTAPYDTWARQMGRPLAPDESSPECPVVDAPAPAQGHVPRIAYPFDGARFVIDPERPRELQRLAIRVDPFDGPVEVRVDGALLADDRAWPLTLGTHAIVAESRSLAGATVHIIVR